MPLRTRGAQASPPHESQELNVGGQGQQPVPEYADGLFSSTNSVYDDFTWHRPLKIRLNLHLFVRLEPLTDPVQAGKCHLSPFPQPGWHRDKARAPAQGLWI